MGVNSKLLHFLTTSKLAMSHDRSLSLIKWARSRKGDAVIVCDFVSVVLWLLGSFHKAKVDSKKYPWHSYVYGGDFDEYAERLLGFVKAMKHLKVEPVFFVDGPNESKMGKRKKREELATRYVKYCHDEREYRSLKHRLKFKPLLFHHLLQELQKSGAEVIICDGEAERSMARYAKDHPNACGIHSRWRVS